MTTLTPAEFFAVAASDRSTEEKVEIGRQWLEQTCAALAAELFAAAGRAPRTPATLATVEQAHQQLLRWREQVLAELELLLVPRNRLN